MQRRDRKLIDLFLPAHDLSDAAVGFTSGADLFLTMAADGNMRSISISQSNAAVTFEAHRSLISSVSVRMLLFALRMQKKYLTGWFHHHHVASSSTLIQHPCDIKDVIEQLWASFPPRRVPPPLRYKRPLITVSHSMWFWLPFLRHGVLRVILCMKWMAEVMVMSAFSHRFHKRCTSSWMY